MSPVYWQIEKIHSDRKIFGVFLNRPEKMNALSTSMIEEGSKVFSYLNEKVESGECLVVILASRAAPKAFCAGADLAERMAMNEKQVGIVLDKLRLLVDGCANIACPTVAAINGIAFGGGLELALACDIRVASSPSMLGLTETRLAIIPGAGGTQRLTRLVGESRSKELIFSGKRLTGIEAEKIGLVNFLNDDPLAAAIQFATEVAGGGPLALRQAKMAIEFAHHSDLTKGLDFERECYDKLIPTKDRVEGLKAFSEKRNPQYIGE